MWKLAMKILFSCAIVLPVLSASNDIRIPFEVVNGLILVEAEIDGRTDNYILDSGSNEILLNDRISESDVSFESLSGSLDAQSRLIERVRVGDFVTGSVSGYITDLSGLEVYLERSVGGILGCAVFTPQSLLFDFENGYLTVSDQILREDVLFMMHALPFRFVDDIPITEIEIDGQRRTFILDSGASAHFIDEALVSSDAFVPTGVEKSIITAEGSTTTSLEYTVDAPLLTGDGGVFHAFAKDFEDLSAALGTEVSGLISLSKLSQGQVVFDLKGGFLYY